MRKHIMTSLIVLVFLVVGIFNVSAVVHTITVDWEDLGVRKIGVEATANDYFGEDDSGEKVHNLRCNYSQWDYGEEYLWVVPDWPNSPKEPAWVYIGSHDMSIMDIISFDYTTDSSADLEKNKVSLTKDKEGKEIVASVQDFEVTGGLSDPQRIEMQIIDADYNGDIYLYVEYTSRMFIGNLTFTTKDDGSTPEPTPEPTPSPEKTATPLETIKATSEPLDSDKKTSRNNSLYVYIASGVVVVIGAVLVFMIWRKKK